jgi:diguanylate cyclase (GGDEF)-like protein
MLRRAREIVLGHEQRSPSGVVLTLIVLAIGITQWVSFPRYAVFAGLVLALNLGSSYCARRGLSLLRRNSSDSDRESQRWSDIQLVLSGLGGCCWGLGSILMGFPADPAPSAVLVIFQGSLMTITTITMGSDRRRYLVFGVPMAASAVVANLVAGQRLNLAIAFGTAVFSLFLQGLQRELNKTYFDNFDLTIRNESLVSELSAANARLVHDNSELQHQVITDPLTRVSNRNGWERALREGIGDGSGPTGAAILIVDVDDFKYVNDTFGHDVGDRVLVSLAQRLRSSVKESDTVARLGGDEFAVLLSNIVTDDDLDSIRKRVSSHLAHTFRHEGSSTTVTISLGAARHYAGDTATDVLVRADECLYDEKRRRTRPARDLGVMETLSLTG